MIDNIDYLKTAKAHIARIDSDSREGGGRMSDLKPCPFCGSGWLYETRRNGYCDETPTMFCNSCKAVVTWEQVEEEGVNDETMAFVREHWNSRAERTCHIEGSYYDELQAKIDAKDNSIENIMQTLHETQALASNMADECYRYKLQCERYEAKIDELTKHYLVKTVAYNDEEVGE